MQFSFAILRRKNQTKSNLKSINELQHEIVGNLNLNCIKVCIIQLDHICFEKSSSTFRLDARTEHDVLVKSTTKIFFKFSGLLRIPKL